MSKSAVVEPPDGVDIIYNDCKTFWKARATIELIILFHHKQTCYEIIAYNPDVDCVAPRLYLDGVLIKKHLDDEEIQRRVSERKEQLLRAKRPFHLTEITKEIVQDMTLSYMMNRINISSRSSEAANSTSVSFAMALNAQTGDLVVDEESRRLDILLQTKPPQLEHVPVTFRKKIKLTSNDIQTALSSVQYEAVQLRQATRLAELAVSSVDGFKKMLQQRAKWRHLRPARVRWIQAINRVLVQNYVAKVTLRIEAIEAAKALVMSMQEEAKDEEEEDLYSRPKTASFKPRRPKILRKSMDGSSLPTITATSPSNRHEVESGNSGSSEGGIVTSFPPLVVSPTARNPLRQSGSFSPSHSGGMITARNSFLLRRSFGDEANSRPQTGVLFSSPTGVSGRWSNSSHREGSSQGNRKVTVENSTSNASAPSLAQSFSQKSSKLVSPLPAHLAFAAGDDNSRSLKMR